MSNKNINYFRTNKMPKEHAEKNTRDFEHQFRRFRFVESKMLMPYMQMMAK